MSFNNGSVHSRGESKIVRINDQPPQGESLAGSEKEVTSDSDVSEMFVWTAPPSATRGARLDFCSVGRRRGVNIYQLRLTVSPRLSYTRGGAVRADAPHAIFDRRGCLAAR